MVWNGPLLEGETQHQPWVPLPAFVGNLRRLRSRSLQLTLLSQHAVPDIESLGLSDQDWGRQPARGGS